MGRNLKNNNNKNRLWPSDQIHYILIADFSFNGALVLCRRPHLHIFNTGGLQFTSTRNLEKLGVPLKNESATNTTVFNTITI